MNANPAPAPTEGTASIELAGRAVEATTAEPKALESWAESVVSHKLKTPLPPLPLREVLSISECRPKWALQMLPLP